jgi:hypothetical protein
MNTAVVHTQFIDASAEQSEGLRDREIGAAIGRWVERWPEALAFLHKRRGRWQAYPRSYIAREVERFAALLKEGSNPGEIRLAASGLYEPDLIILALAALSSGGKVFLLHGDLRGEVLARELAAIRPTHAFVQDRRTIARWFAAAPAGTTRLPLFSAQAFVGGNSAWGVVPLDNSAAVTAWPAWKAWTWRARPRFANIAWIDEGTEWPDGLRRLLDSALYDDLTIAFPETAESAIRDRRQIQPTALILSPARRRQLEEDDHGRRALEGSFSRRLVDRADAAHGGLVSRFVNHRRSVVLGLSRVQPLTAAEPTPAPAPVSA